MRKKKKAKVNIFPWRPTGNSTPQANENRHIHTWQRANKALPAMGEAGQ